MFASLFVLAKISPIDRYEDRIGVCRCEEEMQPAVSLPTTKDSN